MTPLCKLGAWYRTDKVEPGYTKFYNALFGNKRDEVLKVLEIGIGSLEAMKHVPDYIVGASLFMWRDYFPHAEIYALDNNIASVLAMANVSRMHAMHCDQANAGQLDVVKCSAGYGFDLILDDGDHRAASQLPAFHALFPLLKPGGIYIIEDAEGCDGNMELLRAGLSEPHEMVCLKPGGKLVMVKA